MIGWILRRPPLCAEIEGPPLGGASRDTLYPHSAFTCALTLISLLDRSLGAWLLLIPAGPFASTLTCIFICAMVGRLITFHLADSQ